MSCHCENCGMPCDCGELLCANCEVGSIRCRIKTPPDTPIITEKATEP